MPKVANKKKVYKLPNPVPAGKILTDKTKGQWKLGKSIGKGGFGEIYSATKVDDENSDKSYVIKIEPHENGPLFVEMHFYMRNLKKEDVEQYMKTKKLKSLGLPLYLGSGSHESNGEKFRFLVLEKYGTDIWKLFRANNQAFPLETVIKLGLQIIDILEYIHSKGYVHADIKGTNLLLGARKDTTDQVYLIDYGLAGHYFTGETYKPDPKKAHNGTIEYLSTDAHEGVLTRRGDIEILLYNLIQWLGCTLPWEDNLTDVKYVQESKVKYLKNIADFLSKCFKDTTPPGFIVAFIKYLNTLKFDSQPNYVKLKKILLKDLKTTKTSADSKLIFVTSPKRKSDSPSLARKQKRRISNSVAVVDSIKVTKPRQRKKLQEHNGKNEVDSNLASKPSTSTVVTRSSKRPLSASIDKLNDIKPKPASTKSRRKPKEEDNNENAEKITSEMLKYKKKIEERKGSKRTNNN